VSPDDGIPAATTYRNEDGAPILPFSII
jgi:hypothetical protein